MQFDGATGYQLSYQCVVGVPVEDVPGIGMGMFGGGCFSVGLKVKVVITNGIGRENLILFAGR